MNNNIDELNITNEAVVKLLRCLSSDRCDDYNDWIQVCILFKNNYPELWDEFDSWSKGSTNYDYKQNKKHWQAIKPKQSGGLTIGSLMLWAKEDNRKEYNKVIQYIKSQEKEDAKDEADHWYQINKVKVEKIWFKLNSPLKYCRYYNGEIQAYSPADTKEYFMNKNITQIINGKEKTTFFYDKWSKDENIRTYEGIVFDPKNTESKYFNMFNGFEMETEADAVCIPEFDNLIKHIFKSDVNINFFYSWLNQIITQPENKTGVAIILYSDVHGVGKNTIVELIIRLLGSKYCSKLNRIEDITSNFNSHLTQKLFIYGDEIRSRATDLASELKNIITQTEVLSTKKFMDSIKMKDLANYMFTTNEEVAFKIEQHNRRFFCIEVEGKKDQSFYKSFYEALKDDEKVEQFFKYISTYKNLVNLRNIPETDFTQKLKVFSMNAVDHFLYNSLKSYQNNKINVRHFYDIIIQHAKEHRLPYNISRPYVKNILDKLMGVVVDGECIMKKKDKQNTKYCFPKQEIMIKILKIYNESYFKYCDLEDEETDSDDELNTMYI